MGGVATRAFRSGTVRGRVRVPPSSTTLTLTSALALALALALILTLTGSDSPPSSTGTSYAQFTPRTRHARATHATHAPRTRHARATHAPCTRIHATRHARACSGSVSPSSSTITGAFILICSARVPSTRARSNLVMYGVVIRSFFGTATPSPAPLETSPLVTTSLWPVGPSPSPTSPSPSSPPSISSSCRGDGHRGSVMTEQRRRVRGWVARVLGLYSSRSARASGRATACSNRGQRQP